MSLLRERLRARGHHLLRGGYEGGGTEMSDPGGEGGFGGIGGDWGNAGMGIGGGFDTDAALRAFDTAMRKNDIAGMLSLGSKALGIPGAVLNAVFGDKLAGWLAENSMNAGTGGASVPGGEGGNDPIIQSIVNAMNGSSGSNSGSTAGGSANGLDDADWKYYSDTMRPKLTEMWDTNTARGNAMYDKSMEVMNGQLGLATNSANDYTNIVRPFVQKQADYVTQLGSPEYIAAQRAKAMEESQGANENAWAAAQRKMQGLGANVNGGGLAAAQAAWAAEAAKQKVAAAMKSDSDIFGKYGQGLTDMNNYGLAMQKQSGANASTALDWGKYGLTAGLTGFGAGLDLGKLNTATASASSGAVTANKKTNNDYALGLRTSDRADDAANPWTTMAGGILGSVGKAVGGKVGDAAGDWFSGLFS